MSRVLTIGGLVVAAAVVAFAMGGPAMSSPSRMQVVQQAGGECGCPKGLRCCFDCNGNRLCVRSILQCPECPAP